MRSKIYYIEIFFFKEKLIIIYKIWKKKKLYTYE